MFFVKNKFFLYLWGGLLNTIISIALYNIFAIFFKVNIAFSLTWISGILFSYFFNKIIVFQKISNVCYIAVFAIVYFVIYIFSLYLFNSLISFNNISESFALLIIIFLFSPIYYWTNKIFFIFFTIK